jgi:spore germination cell wall hydrolase CwlJ-like protein
METSLKSLHFVLGLALVVMLTNAITSYKFLKLQNQKSVTETASTEVVEKQLDCLAMNIYREAGFEPFEGKVAVAQVTLNRVADTSGKFPKKVCEVVYQKNKFMEKVVCQFSWYCEHLKTPTVNKEAYDESYTVAKKVLLEGFRLDGLRSALYYHADYINPNWHLKRIMKIGQHIFYKGNDDDETHAN